MPALLILGWTRLRGISLCERDGTLPGLLAGLLFAAGEFALLYSGLLFSPPRVIFLAFGALHRSARRGADVPGDTFGASSGWATGASAVSRPVWRQSLQSAGGTWVGDAT